MTVPAGRFSLAFNQPSLTWNPTWTALDQDYPNLLAGYTIDRGRQYELDHTDTGRATVTLNDVDGILDPTNTFGPYYGVGYIEPLIQAVICRQNPLTGDWEQRFRGFVEDFDYEFDPSQKVNRVTITLVDLFEILAAAEMQPATFGTFTGRPRRADDQVWFENMTMQGRIEKTLEQALGATPIWDAYSVVFSGNVDLFEGVYSPGESALTAIWDACDAEFPGVSNVYVDRFGRLCAHGRLAKFDPHGTWLTLGASGAARDAKWRYREWKAGDGAAVLGSPSDTAQLRRFSFNRGLSKVINSAYAMPVDVLEGVKEEVAKAIIEGQLVQDPTSIGLRGIRSWAAEDLLTLGHRAPDTTTALVETRNFAEFYVANYKQPQNRITEIALRSMQPSDPHAEPLWTMISEVDIADSVEVTVGSPGGGGFILEPYFVEGVHEEVRPLGVDEYDDVTVTLDLSPRAYFTDTDMFPNG